jgi:hypothetical protein
VLCGEQLLDQADRSRVRDVEVDLVEERLERGKVAVEELFQAYLRALEAQYGDAEQRDDRPADPAFDGERAQDERGPKLLATQQRGRIVSRTASVRLAEDVRAAAQAAPGIAERRGGFELGAVRRLVRRIRDVPVARA